MYRRCDGVRVTSPQSLRLRVCRGRSIKRTTSPSMEILKNSPEIWQLMRIAQRETRQMPSLATISNRTMICVMG